MQRSSWYRAGPLVFASAAILGTGCDNTSTSAADGGTADLSSAATTDLSKPGAVPDLAGAGGGDLASTPDLAVPNPPTPLLAAATTSGDYLLPLDAVPDSQAASFYFTAMNAKGLGVFKVAAAGGAAGEVAVGAPFVSPFGIAISNDDKTVYVADRVAGYDPNQPRLGDAPGQIFSLSATGGSPSALSGTLGYAPIGMDLHGTEIWFTGTDPADGKAGLFTLPAGGGAPTVVAKGDPFRGPSGVTVTGAGEAYVADTNGASNGQGRLLKVSKGTATVVADNLPLGFPAGAALTLDEHFVLVSGQDRNTGTSVVYVVDLSSGMVTLSNGGPLQGSQDSGGLHRASGTNVMSWCGVTVGDRGTVFQVTFK